MSPPTKVSNSRSARKKAGSKSMNEELSKRILLLCIEHLIPFEQINSSSFRLLFNFNNGLSFIPDPETLTHLANEMYSEYQNYFKHYFENSLDKAIKISLSLHKWTPSNSLEPYVFANYHFINERFRLCELPLGFFPYTEKNMSQHLIPNPVLKERLLFVTSNHDLDDYNLQMVKYLMDEDGDITKSSQFHCLTKLFGEYLLSFFIEVAEILSLETKLAVFDIGSITGAKLIPVLVCNFIYPIYIKFHHLSFEKLDPLPDDKDRVCWGTLKKLEHSHDKAYTMRILSCLITYRANIEQLISDSTSSISESDWELITFAYEITIKFHEVLITTLSYDVPVSHLLSKWVKMLILHVLTITKRHSQLLSFNIELPLKKLFDNLKETHSKIEANSSLILATYLHPSTKRFLRDDDVNAVNSFVESLSKEQENEKPTSIDSFDNVDDMILNLFDCSGKSTKECYNYESSSMKEIKETERNSYAKEVGPSLLSFWSTYARKYPTLSQLARNVLAVPITTDRGFDQFKSAFTHLNSPSSASPEIVPLSQLIYFLHRLGTTYDLHAIDPKNLDLDIEDYRITDYEE
ncbi:hypothetical protein PICST_30756 [Scheffersomyces stipitis CBS 6054]|uniref:HAT C-terminal dimerisation domain-containing protein n=1 Tax=Scheffersomyces stipitis (strain ATCC 58785 / CBS 6054 / NBRC 10063 / NRRL Y-11545) TaxID=322104 RepID=A3LRN8_PICST|nr:hypothetical protein PICST_30756 [Scheffersomyces stipitis CBS 6054]ABN65768.2 hypothetical protein PICST_30756 [Scheffersomyces stipitis CBS 6054]KAG2733668.1 hypothetical protein G9P44_003193 [Scheffersomyces stipitis]